MATPSPLAPEALCSGCESSQFPFETTAELEPLDDAIGQDRAVEAVTFGVGIRRHGYNLFALGPPGTGRHDFVRRHLELKAAKEPVPSDWCYVNNFAEPHKPKTLRLPAGKGFELRERMERLIDDVKASIAAAFESEEYRARREAIDNEFKERQESAFEELQKRAQERNIAVLRTPMGLALAPINPANRGEVLNPEEFHRLPEDAQAKIKADIEELEGQLATIMRQAPQWQKEHREKLRELDRETTENAVGHLLDDLRSRYQEMGQVLPYLAAVQEDIIENADDFLTPEEGPQAQALAMRRSLAGPPSFRRYQVNVIADRRGEKMAPIIYEDHPTQPNLIGRIEQMAQFGTLVTDFNLIKPGALHRANGGYLILDARRLLMQPMAWEELKRALRARDIRIEGLAEVMGLVSTVSLQPEAIPLDVKVVLVGDRQLYYMLSSLDPDFAELFKVTVDFDDRIERGGENATLYARLLGTIASREKLFPLDRGAVARVIEHSARLAGDSERLTTHTRSVADLLRESDYWARQDGHQVITASDVQRALDAQMHRLDRIRERSQEEITRGTIMIDTDGAEVGQVNALSVLQLGELSFGRPTRITARVRLGRGEVVDIEREVELGGPLHSKGVLILAGFLGERFAGNYPLALSASLVFEQSYGGVDGDSASSTELYALLSALSGVPIKQCFAVTGSVNQRGEVQPIGGANEKIEGFYDVCNARGLTGDQGVLIPSTNVKHLMLRPDVVAACREGKFHVWPIETIDQGIELLTGVPAGAPDADGNFPEGTVNGRVAARLKSFADAAAAFGRAARGGNDG